ncbi:MAG: hypothetical protein KF905_15555 [Flavobacteriales bacterium]|nr:hypothetical protein [Flavobacteriales bacterium]
MKWFQDPLRIHAVPTRQLSAFRWVWAVLFMFYGLPEYTFLGTFPDLLFSPPYYSLANLLSGWPTAGFFLGLTVLNLLAFTCIALGLFTRQASVLFSLTALIGHNFKYSFGKIDHSELFLLVAPLFLAFAGWGRHFSFDAIVAVRRGRLNTTDQDVDNGTAMGLLALSFAVAMLSSGLMKLQGGWAAWDIEAIKGNMTRNVITTGRENHWTGPLLAVDSHLFWKLADYGVLLFEIGFILAVLSRRLWMAFLLGTIVFHYAIWQTFQIAFYHNPVFYLVFIKWPPGSVKWPAFLQDGVRDWLFAAWSIVVVLFAANALRYLLLGLVQGYHWDYFNLLWRFGIKVPKYDLVFLGCATLFVLAIMLGSGVGRSRKVRVGSKS